MTDKKTVKALECCTGCDCKHCPYYDGDTDNDAAHCKDSLIMDALNLVNFQKRGIFSLIQKINTLLTFYGLQTEEQVKQIMSETRTVTAKIRAKAIKEFAERLKENIDRIAEEMPEETNNAE
jgi:hypothetical protein